MTLGVQLRRLRESRGITREQAGESLRASHTKISRLELGRVGFKEHDIADLLALYAVTDPDEREAFFNLARQANSPGWWHRYSDFLPMWLETYLGLEQSATVIRSYESQFVPGLLQTANYARALIQRVHNRAPRARSTAAYTCGCAASSCSPAAPYGSGPAAPSVRQRVAIVTLATSC